MENIFYTKSFRVLVYILLIILILFFAVIGITAARSWGKGSINKAATEPQISVTGTGDAFAVPDTATFSFSITEDGATTVDAQNKATAVETKALAYLKNQSIPDTDIQTTDYNISPQYSYSNCGAGMMCPASQQTLTGYEANETIQVKVENESNAGTILGGIASTGVQNISSLSFTVANEDAINRQAREKAIADAKAKAGQLAQDLGVNLGKIVSFQEDNSSPGPIYPMATLSAAKSDTASVPVLPTGQNKVTSNVTITYDIN